MGLDNILCCGSMPMYSPIEDFIDADCGCGSYPPGMRRESCDNGKHGTTDEHHLSKTAGNALRVTPPPSSQSSSQRVSGKFISLDRRQDTTFRHGYQ